MRAVNIWGWAGGGCQGVAGVGEESKGAESGMVLWGKYVVEIEQIEAKTWTTVLLLALRCFMCGQALLFRALSPSHRMGDQSCTLQSPPITYARRHPDQLNSHCRNGAEPLTPKESPLGDFNACSLVRTPRLKESQASFQP